MATITVTEVAAPLSESSLLDDEITALILQLEEVDDSEDIFTSKGKYSVDNPPDSRYAYDNFQADLQKHLSFLRDLRLAHSIAHAVDTDGRIIAELTAPEQIAQEDRRLAIRLNIQEAVAPPCPMDQMQDSCLHAVSHSFQLDGIDTEPVPGPSMTYAERQAKTFGRLSEELTCGVCFEELRGTSILTMPCNDRYCRPCLKRLFLNATSDETLFPPRCCRQPIPLEYIQRDLNPTELESFRNAEVEFSTPNRTYCSNANCGRFVPPDHIENDKAQCVWCDNNTCTLCKTVYHENDVDCPADPALQAAVSLGREQGWQRCYSCRTMVELEYGCNHMTWVASSYLSRFHRKTN
jgi:hypothetical protein